MKEKPTEELILNAAMKVFTRDGFASARTEDIAKEAGINRTLLHYYYRDKQTIFNLIFETRFREFFGGLFEIFNSQDSLEIKLKRLIEHEISTLLQHPDLPRFIIGEIAHRPQLLIEYGLKLGLNPRLLIVRFEEQVEQAIQRGEIRPIAARQLLINVMSLCIYPFVAQPIIMTMMQFDQQKLRESLEQRKTEVFEFVMNAIKKHA